jgi:cob(I)alamin adenosyltransferase
MSISTRKGDAGETDLLFGRRISKSSPRAHALGDVDELNAALGVLLVHAKTSRAHDLVKHVQPLLIQLMGELATPAGEETRYSSTFGPGIQATNVAYLDQHVAEIEAMGMTFKGWVLPGQAGKPAGAFADLARAVTRRAERSVASLEPPLPNKSVLAFLNRLSDVLWLLARVEDRHE